MLIGKTVAALGLKIDSALSFDRLILSTYICQYFLKQCRFCPFSANTFHLAGFVHSLSILLTFDGPNSSKFVDISNFNQDRLILRDSLPP